MGETLQAAVGFASFVGKDGDPLFPTVLGSLDFIEGLIDRRLIYTAPGDDPMPVAERYM